ncbi:hypothetical protein SmJEL517_g04012 [Synchytrium microbalum]|uniref:Phosphoserine phosphatase n=1 Tax=Synchytrium microbalum TaxID=1806994 RepID=A0A507C602_9FUNG|nr:uncharacterized protein SmJEL517_g04012 [Synchytrium microbalum]TPX32973.1 hypothetical protein SmJEL517_g04012 [Synchytrium microbalum]
MKFPALVFLALLMDFDETITIKDSTSHISHLAYANDPTRSPLWSHFTSYYYEDWERQANSSETRNASTLEAYLTSFRHVEEASIARINDSKVLRDIERHDLSDGVDNASLVQPFFYDFLDAYKHAHPETKNIKIVSLNWSKDLVSGVSGVPNENVISNDLEFDGDVSTGFIAGGVFTGVDKLASLQAVMPDFGGEELYGIGVGDSVSDLPMLLKAALGIMMKPKKSVYDVCKRFNIRIESLSAYQEDAERPIVYSVDGWDEIHSTLLSGEQVELTAQG